MPNDNGGTLRWPFDLSAFGKIKLGSGIVGKTAPLVAYAALAAAIAIAALAYSGATYLAFTVFVLLVILVAGYVWKAFDFGAKHPGAALMADAELLQLYRLAMGAKDPTIAINNTEMVPNVPPPAIEDRSDGV